jgi:hypothetical protein
MIFLWLYIANVAFFRLLFYLAGVFLSDAILQEISDAGFRIVMQREMQLEREDAEKFYAHIAGEPFYEELVSRMSRY